MGNVEAVSCVKSEGAVEVEIPCVVVVVNVQSLDEASQSAGLDHEGNCRRKENCSCALEYGSFHIRLHISADMEDLVGGHGGLGDDQIHERPCIALIGELLLGGDDELVVLLIAAAAQHPGHDAPWVDGVRHDGDGLAQLLRLAVQSLSALSREGEVPCQLALTLHQLLTAGGADLGDLLQYLIDPLKAGVGGLFLRLLLSLQAVLHE